MSIFPLNGVSIDLHQEVTLPSTRSFKLLPMSSSSVIQPEERENVTVRGKNQV